MTQTSLGPVVRHIRKLVGADAVRELTDTELLERFVADREERAFAALLRRHGPLVWSVCWQVLHHRQDAEDAFQATFLLLARQAGSIRRTEAVPSWLYRVAYRVATKARVNMARQRFQERQVERVPRLSQPCHTVSPPEAEVAWRELQAVLNEELDRLPEKHRAPFLMCCLEGKSGPEAARQLGWKLGTLTSRLTEARKLLQRRLARRGVMLSAVLAAATVARAGAAVASIALAEGTVKAALAFTGHATTAGVVSANAAALVEGMARKLLVTKLKVATALLLAASVATGTGIVTHQALAEKAAEAPPAAKKSESPAKEAVKSQAARAKPITVPKDEKAETVQVSGHVLDPDGKPVAGAKVYLLDQASAKVRATTGADGGFQFTAARAELKLNHGYTNPWMAVFLLATSEGYGPALDQLKKPDHELKRTLRLVKDHPVEGRVLDLQGKPVVGAKIQVNQLSAPNSGDLTAFLDDLKKRPDGYPAENNCLTTAHNPALVHLYPELTSDKDGRFQLAGIGRERVAGLTISGPTIESKQVRVRTRPGETISRLEWKDFPKTGTLTYYGAKFEHAAGPTRPIEGVVLDRETGKPVSFAVVESIKLAGDDLHGRNFIRTRADKDGRYRLVGMPKGQGNLIQAVPPEDQPYLPEIKGLDDPAGLEVAHVDFGLLRGVRVKGKVTEKDTGKPATANLEYFVFSENPALKRYPQGSFHHRLDTNEDGSFQFVGVPGRSLVAARGNGDRWVVGVGSEKYKERDPIGHLRTSPPCLAIGFHTLVEIEAAEGAAAVDCKIVLDPGRTVKGIVHGPGDKPLAGARICGVKSYAYTYWEGDRLATAEFTALGVSPARPRRLLFLHEGKHLAGSIMVRGEEKSPPTVKLEPWGVVMGKLVTEGGQPPAGAELRFMSGGKFDDPDDGSHPTRAFPIGKDGTFRIEGMAPGLKYHLAVLQKGRITGYVFQNCTFKAGENKDLGDVQAKE